MSAHTTLLLVSSIYLLNSITQNYVANKLVGKPKWKRWL
jgi:hypothetical protein